jgi:hypothetical protein
LGIYIHCEELDPILTTPGGWGLRNPVPKGPGQRSFILIAVQHGGGLTEFGRHYDLPNVRVMRGWPTVGHQKALQILLAAIAGRVDHVTQVTGGADEFRIGR